MTVTGVMKTARLLSRTSCYTQTWTLGVTNWRWYKTWKDEDCVTYSVFYTKLNARCDKLALVQDLCVMKTYCVTYSVFYTKLDARCDKLALVVMKTARLLRHVQRVLHKAGRSV